MHRNQRLILLALVAVAVSAFVLRDSNDSGHEVTPANAADLRADQRPVRDPFAPVKKENRVRYDRYGVAIGGIEPNPSGGVPLNIDNIIASADKAVVVSRDQQDTFTVPLPKDPEWSDYLEYRRHFRSSLDDTPGFAVAYDPEWRTALAGRREAPDPGLELFGGAEDLRGLLVQVVQTVCAQDEQGLIDLALRKEEYEVICWPSFPQSRPYLRYKVEEGWGFQYANDVGGIRSGERQVGDRELDLSSIGYGEVVDYGNFQLYNDIKIGAVDKATGEAVELSFVNSVIERNGVFKVFMYHD